MALRNPSSGLLDRLDALPGGPVSPGLADALLAALAAGLAWFTARMFTPHMREAALRCGIVDRPDGRLKQHCAPVPYLGGLAVALGVLIALGVTFRFDRDALAVLLAGAIVLILVRGPSACRSAPGRARG